MKTGVPTLLILCAALLGTGADTALSDGRPAAATDSAAERLLRDLEDLAHGTRVRALERLESLDGLSEAMVREALLHAGPRARPLLLELVGRRRMAGLVEAVVPLTSSADPATAGAAVRALVLLGDDAVQAGVAHLTPLVRQDAVAAGAVRRLLALRAQRAVEAEVFGRWQRKGGSYLGRYADLERFGWPVQPVLLAMLLDVPLEERFVVLPGVRKSPLGRLQEERDALTEIYRSRRRGYRSFETPPEGFEPEDLYEAARQALSDVASTAHTVEVLDDIASNLRLYVRLAQRVLGDGFAAQTEEYLAENIEMILAARGRPDSLLERIRALESSVERYRGIAATLGSRDTRYLQWYSQELNHLARVYHGGQYFEQAAATYREEIRVATLLAGQAPPIPSYNLACALARTGATDEALTQLDRALALGVDDLPRRWVEDDGDLLTLHADPRFAEIVEKYYPTGGSSPDGE